MPLKLTHAPLEAVLFDIDGTLCDSDPIHYRAFVQMLRKVSSIFYIMQILFCHTVCRRQINKF